MDQTLSEQLRTGTGTSSGRQQPSSPPPPTSLLESLPTDVLVMIMSAARSTADLHSLIRASLALYKVFLSAKRGVLISIVARDLGPALRDGVAATLIIPTRIESRAATYAKECECAIQRYEALPRGGGGLALTRGLSTDAVVALVRTNSSVQFLIDELAASRLPALGRIHPDAASPLTANERQHLAQALLRHQVLARLGGGHPRPHETAVIHRFFGLSSPWEMHQLADVHGFLCEMTSRAFVCCEEPWRPSRANASLGEEKDAALGDLGVLHRKLVAERARMAADPSLVVVAEAHRRVPPGGMAVPARFNFLIAGPLPAQKGSDRVAEGYRELRDELYRREDAMPLLLVAEEDDADADAPPFAWVDAHHGINCQRWGWHARREVMPVGQADTTARQRIWMQQKLELWRWLGFVFWDRGRVELLKTRLPEYATGWLTVAPPPDGECKLSEKVRLPRRG
ncbi:F-box domain-containing protein [Madurella fahalii]|uniref:F-box domain-containing protein n=1 Tax=Madurella fahalii TaxID=1157608 RepID=A0ABQ0GH84_9PEZI